MYKNSCHELIWSFLFTVWLFCFTTTKYYSMDRLGEEKQLLLDFIMEVMRILYWCLWKEEVFILVWWWRLKLPLECCLNSNTTDYLFYRSISSNRSIRLVLIFLPIVFCICHSVGWGRGALNDHKIAISKCIKRITCELLFRVSITEHRCCIGTRRFFVLSSAWFYYQ